MVIQVVAHELGSEQEVSPNQHSELLSDIMEACDEAEAIIQAILSLSQARQSPPSFVPCAPLKLLETAINNLEHKVVARQGRFKRIGTPHIYALGHAPWIERIWVNLIDNALKYGGDSPEITVGVSSEGNWVKCWISDNGPGLPKSIRNNLSDDFKPSSLIESTRSISFGIGLSLVYELVAHMGGKIDVEGEYGAHISFSLPSPTVVNKDLHS